MGVENEKQARVEQEATDFPWESWIELSKNIFPPASIGYEDFPEILEGRRRPLAFFNLSHNTSFFWNLPDKASLMANGIETMGQLFALTKLQISSYPHGGRIEERLGYFFKYLAVTPHTRLVAAACWGSEEDLGLLSPAIEKEQIEGVQKFLPSFLTDREASVLERRYGLKDGVRRTLEEVGEEKGVTRGRISQIEGKALRKLRHPKRGIRQYLPLARESFGRSVLGMSMVKEAAQLQEEIDKLGFSKQIEAVLSDKLRPLLWRPWSAIELSALTVGDVAIADPVKLGLSAAQGKEITEKLKEFVATKQQMAKE